MKITAAVLLAAGALFLAAAPAAATPPTGQVTYTPLDYADGER